IFISSFLFACASQKAQVLNRSQIKEMVAEEYLKTQKKADKRGRLEQIEIKTPKIETQGSAAEQKIDIVIAELRNLTSAIRKEKTAPTLAEKEVKKVKNIIVKKIRPADYSEEITDLTSRLANVEDKFAFVHPEIKTKGVIFGAASSKLILCKSDIKDLDEIIKKNKAKLIRKITITAYTDKTKPKKSGLLNKTISQKRAEAMALYLKDKGGIEIQPESIYNGCETDRYGTKNKNDQNRRVVIAYEEKENAPE
ncbi:OmpA family protein, partial [Candidatus Parcubacteria bacterium]|nr:OmpA family protein [Candidatus Parcubacteria bacterium]